jgi:hypothetical protein
MRSTGRALLSLCGVAVAVGGLAAALALLLVPLRLVAVSGGGIGYCGPGFSSDNALQVRINPGIVNTGGGGGQQASTAQQQQLAQVCANQANGRLIAAAGTAGVALVLGLPLIALGRRRQDSISASASGPSSLSSSGTSGSTVWK